MKEKKIPFYFSDWFIYLLPLFSVFLGTAFPPAFALFFSPIILLNLRKYDFVLVDVNFLKLNKSIEDLNSKINNLETEYVQKEADLRIKTGNLETEYELKKEEYEKQYKNEENVLRSKLKAMEGEITYKYTNVELEEDITSPEIKSKLELLKVKETELLKSDNAVKILYELPKKVADARKRQILRSFNSEVGALLSKLTVSNTDKSRAKITQSYTALNKIFEIDGVSLTPEFLENKLKQLDLIYSYQLKLELEKEQQLAIKEQMQEEEKVRREIEQEKKRIEKEEKQFNAELSKMLSYLSKANNDIEKNIYADKIKELEEKIKLLEKDKENVLQRETNTRAGFVYIISNIGSFGEDVFKIGMTRRLEPMDRVKELGSASVPFEFDVHAMIFSDDAPALENMLHKEFRNYQLNKINPRKEFFKVDLQKIVDIVRERFNATTEFTMTARAEQYYESLKI